MKRLLLLSLLFAATTTFAQTFTDTATLNTYVRDTIKDRRPEKVTAAQIQKAFLGVTQVAQIGITEAKNAKYVDTLKRNANGSIDWTKNGNTYTLPGNIDSAYRSGDSIKYTKNGVTNSVFAGNKNFVNGAGVTELFRLPAGAIINSFVPNTKSGAMSTATITNVGAFDQIAVGGDQTSYVEFSSRQQNIGEVLIRWTVKIDSLGTAPLLGIQERHVGGGGTYSNFSQGTTLIYVNLLTGTITHSGLSGAGMVAKNNLPSGVSVGDVVDIYFRRQTADYYVFTIERRGLSRETSSVYSFNVAHADNSWGTPSNQHCYEGIILAGGKYTIFDYSISSPYFAPKVLTIGDSWSSGSRIARSVSFDGWLNQKWTYKAVLGGASSCMLAGVIACSDEIVKLKPQTVLLVSVLDGIFYGYSDSTSGSFATFDANMKKIYDIVKQSGAKLAILCPAAIPTLDPTGSKGVKFYNYVTTAFPDALILDMRNVTTTVDASGFHPDATYYSTMADRYIKLLQSNGLL